MSKYTQNRMTSTVLKDTVKLLGEVLSWRFEDPSVKLNVSFKLHMNPPKSIQPNASWCNLLITSGTLTKVHNFYSLDTVEFFFKLYALRDPDLSHVLLLAITQLASINGSIFGSDAYPKIHISSSYSIE
jgi:hypothetical protein